MKTVRYQLHPACSRAGYCQHGIFPFHLQANGRIWWKGKDHGPSLLSLDRMTVTVVHRPSHGEVLVLRPVR